MVSLHFYLLFPHQKTWFAKNPLQTLALVYGPSAVVLVLLLWGALVVSTIDNIIRPLIISAGSDLPFVLVLLGVLGGAVAFGFVGVFVGPVLLALGYALLNEWATHEPVPEEAANDANGKSSGILMVFEIELSMNSCTTACIAR